MKGDNSGKLNRATELFYKLSLRDDFQQDILRIRRIFDIKDKNSEVSIEKSIDFFAEILDMMTIYSIPIMYRLQLIKLIKFSSLVELEKPIVAFIDEFSHRKDMGEGHIEDLYKERGDAFVKIILLENANKKDVHRFIDSNWKKISEIMMEQGHESKRVRSKKEQNKLRDALIVKYSKMSLIRLRSISGIYDVKILKENLIAKILLFEGYRTTDGYIRKIVQKYRV